MRSHTIRIRVRNYEMDVLGHVNNAVYLHYVDEAAIRHAEAVGLGIDAMRALGGMWVVRQHTITYRRPAVAGDELDVTTTVVSMARVRAHRRTTIVHVATGQLVADCETEWVWVSPDGRPRQVPAAMLAVFSAGDTETAPPEPGDSAG